MTTTTLDLNTYIRDIPDFPKPGIMFKDISPLLKDAQAFKATIDRLVDHYRALEIDYVVGIESRGFLVGAPLAYHLGKGFIPIRKPGKLPYKTESIEYALEYGSGSLEIHADALAAGQRILVVDDLLATGGTVAVEPATSGGMRARSACFMPGEMKDSDRRRALRQSSIAFTAVAAASTPSQMARKMVGSGTASGS